MDLEPPSQRWRRDFGGTKPIVQTIVSERAQAIGAQIVPIIEQLTPLIPDADLQKLEALRCGILAAVRDLVEELNRER